MQKIRFNESNPKLPELCRTVKEICKVLPTLDVKGDNKTVFVDEHSNGKVIRAKPKGSNGVGGSAEGSSVYDGMWAFSDYYNESGYRYLRINGGFYNRNGLYIKMNMTDPWTLGHHDILWSNFRYVDIPYYIYIYQNWNYNTKLWDEPKILYTNNYTDLPFTHEHSDSLARGTTIEGYALLGVVNTRKNPQWICMNTPIPIMIVTGSCLYDQGVIQQ